MNLKIGTRCRKLALTQTNFVAGKLKEYHPNILFALPESVLDKSKARFKRLQNSPAAQTVAIADLALRQDLFVKLQLRKRSVTELIS